MEDLENNKVKINKYINFYHNLAGLLQNVVKYCSKINYNIFI